MTPSEKSKLQELVKLIESLLDEPEKPKDGVRFEKGDFFWNDNYQDRSLHGFALSIHASDKFAEWRDSFYFLAYHCLELGGIVGAKPEAENYYTAKKCGSNDWVVECYGWWRSLGFFWFTTEEQAERFLETPGVKANLNRFYSLSDKD